MLKKIPFMLAAFPLLLAGTAGAATDGLTGSTSSGTSQVQVTKGEVARISNMDDFIATWSATAPTDIELSDNVCVYTNDASDEYQVTATTANVNPSVSTDFRLSDGSNFVPYTVFWADSENQTVATSTQLFQAQQTAVNTFGNADDTNPDCLGLTNATLSVSIASAALSAVPDGVYADTLTITIEPD